MAIVEIKLLRSRSEVPRYATDGSGAVDLIACVDKPVVLWPGEVAMVPTGIAVHIGDPCLAMVLLPRSGLGARDGMVLANLVGLVDSDYQGEVKLAMWNRSPAGGPNGPFVISSGDRVAQAVFVPVSRAVFQVVKEFSATTKRGDGGFGSTG